MPNCSERCSCLEVLHLRARRPVRAAEAIFNHAPKAIEIEDIDARVTELERAAEAKNKG